MVRSFRHIIICLKTHYTPCIISILRLSSVYCVRGEGGRLANGDGTGMLPRTFNSGVEGWVLVVLVVVGDGAGGNYIRLERELAEGGVM